MNLNDPKIVSLRATVNAAREEFDMAIMFHEMWKPTVHDGELRSRMGVSYATKAFHITQVALRRETLLALTRLWDKSDGAVRLWDIAKYLRDEDIINTLAAGGASLDAGIAKAIRKNLAEHAKQALVILDKYSVGGSHEGVLKSLRLMRDKRLAHRDIHATMAPPGPDSSDDAVEAFIQDMSKLISLLLHLTERMAYDPAQTAEVYGVHAEFFWAPVRGERTPGHPSYRAPQPTYLGAMAQDSAPPEMSAR